MTDVLTLTKTTKIVSSAFFLALFASMLMALYSPLPSAQASGCGDVGSFGCETGAPPSGGGNNGGGGNPTPGPGGGSNGGGQTPGTGGSQPPRDPYGKVVRTMGSSGCAVRDDGRAAVGADNFYSKIFDYGADDVTPPGGSAGGALGLPWVYQAYIPGFGFLWEAEIFVSKTCLYPPRTYLTTATCVISSTANVSMVAPQSKSLATKTTTSGYSQGSTNYNACINSNTRAGVGVALDEYGMYTSTAVSRAQIATVEVAYTANEATGEFPAPKIIALSAPFSMAPRSATASVDCANGFRTPGVNRSDWSENACSSANSNNPTFICRTPAVLVDVAEGNRARSMKAVGNGGSLQLMRDGKSRLVQFNQSVTGSSIKVDSIRTRFIRSENSTPWNSGGTYTKNLFELRSSEGGGSVLSRERGTSTPSYTFNRKDIFAVGYSASEFGAPTRITQAFHWKGTRTIRSATITSIDGRTGAITAVPTTRTVPTNGNCEQTVNLEYVRPIGDSIR